MKWTDDRDVRIITIYPDYLDLTRNNVNVVN